MNRILPLLALLPALPALAAIDRASASDEIGPLVPDATLRFECPELPPTLLSMHTGKEETPRVSVRLPVNYSAEKNFPLFVWMDGGAGGDARGSGVGRLIMEGRDFIFVKLPLFKKELNRNPQFSALYITARDDGETISHAYRTLLGRVYGAIPNIDTENNVVGGFSNGGHSIAAIFNTGDPWLLERLRHIVLVEGGLGLIGDESTAERKLLVLYGGAEDRRPGLREAYVAMHERALAGGADSTCVVMPDTGHTFPEAYYPSVRKWVYGAIGAADTQAPDPLTPRPHSTSSPNSARTPQKPFPSSPPQGHGLGKTWMKRTTENQFHKSQTEWAGRIGEVRLWNHTTMTPYDAAPSILVCLLPDGRRCGVAGCCAR